MTLAGLGKRVSLEGMVKSLKLSQLICAGLLVSGAAELRGGEPTDKAGVVERVARVFSGELRRAEARLDDVAGELASLPRLRATPLAERYGFRSDTLPDANQPHWVQIDLGRLRAIDRIVVVPAHLPDLGAQGEGYGFPLRFKIEVADNAEMRRAATLVDRTGEDVPNPGRFPMNFNFDPVEARHVRFTSTRHVAVEGGFMWALEELTVLAGNRVLTGNRVIQNEVLTSGSLELFPNWSRQRIDDSQSALGLPVSVETSPTLGYLSAATRDSLEEKWLQIDLGETYPIDEIRLVAAESDAFEVVGGRGNPRLMMVELSEDGVFSGPMWQQRAGGGELLGYPGGCADILQASGYRARYLRIVTKELWSREQQRVFALAEVQVYSGGKNVALGKRVTAKDITDKPASAGWAPEFVVDGFSSKYRLIEYPQYLDLLGQRATLQCERDSLNELRASKVRSTSLVLGYGGASLGAVAIFGCGWMLVRQRTVRRRAVANLREQIARDLHDDIGSNLGGIVLLSQMGSRHCEDTQAREDFAAIKDAAEKTSQSMQDIVWLIGRGGVGLRDLVARMRAATEMILGDTTLSLKVDLPDFSDYELSLFFRRHLFFAFKEVLNNVRKHAAATEVEVKIAIVRGNLTFEIRDDGVGFDPERAIGHGNGLANLERRAQRLNGTCRIQSSPGEDARIFFEAPLKSHSK